MEFLLATENVPFAIAISLMFLIGLFEGAGTLMGIGISDLLDSFIPDFEVDVDVEIGEIGSNSALSRLLGWLRVGKVPILMLLVIFLFAFGVIGYALNFMASNMFGLLLPVLVTAPFAIAGAMPATRAGAGILQAIMPKDETSAIRQESLIGRTAHITIGKATETLTAEAKVVDQFGTNHYVRVKPEEGHGPFTTNEPLLLVRKEGSNFIVIAADSSASNLK